MDNYGIKKPNMQNEGKSDNGDGEGLAECDFIVEDCC